MPTWEEIQQGISQILNSAQGLSGGQDTYAPYDRNLSLEDLAQAETFRDKVIKGASSYLPDVQLYNPFKVQGEEHPTLKSAAENAMQMFGPDTVLGPIMSIPFGLGIIKPSGFKKMLHIPEPYSYGQLKNIPEEVLQAIKNTEKATINPSGNLSLMVSRYQKPEQFGDLSVRGGVFYLPELKSPYQKYYSTGKYGYGGGDRFEGMTTIENPLITKAGTGGIAPANAYDYLKGMKSYEDMRRNVLENTVMGWNKKVDEQMIKDLLYKYGGNPDLAYSILKNSKGGNLLPYAIQENIIANQIKNAGYDSVLGVSKANKMPRLSELFDVRPTYYPDYGENILNYPDFYTKYK